MNFFVFSDDLTGAYDIAVNGRAYHRDTRVIWEKEDISDDDGDLVFCTKTREMSSSDSRGWLNEVLTVTKKRCSPKIIYMKVDSMLRGNIIDDVIVVNATYDFDFVVIDVAYPQLKRVVKNSNIFINGKKIQNTDIVYDIKYSKTSDVFLDNLQTAFNGKVQCLKPDEMIDANSKVLFYDTEKEEDFIKIIQKLTSLNAKVLWVGSIGLYLALLKTYYKPKNVFCIIGSVSDLSEHQILRAQSCETSLVRIGQCHEHIEFYVRKILELMKSGKNVILYSERVQYQLSPQIDNIIEDKCFCVYTVAERVMDKIKDTNIIVSGGETAMRVLSKKSIKSVNIVGEIEKSVPLLAVQDGENKYAVLIKSGRVGDVDSLCRHIEFLTKYTVV